MRTAAAAYELSAFEGDGSSLTFFELSLVGKEIDGAYHLESRFLQFSQRRLVSRVRSDHPRPQRGEVAAGCPLLAVLHDSARAAAKERLHWQSTLPERGEEVSLFLHVALALPPVKYRESVRTDEVRGIDDAQVAIDLSENHVQVNGRRFLRHYDNDEVRNFGLLENERREAVDTGRAGALAETDQQDIFTKRMDVAAFQCVIAPAFGRAVVKNPLVCELGMEGEERFHYQLFGPASMEPHGADHHVLIDRHR